MAAMGSFFVEIASEDKARGCRLNTLPGHWGALDQDDQGSLGAAAAAVIQGNWGCCGGCCCEDAAPDWARDQSGPWFHSGCQYWSSIPYTPLPLPLPHPLLALLHPKPLPHPLPPPSLPLPFSRPGGLLCQSGSCLPPPLLVHWLQLWPFPLQFPQLSAPSLLAKPGGVGQSLCE